MKSQAVSPLRKTNVHISWQAFGALLGLTKPGITALLVFTALTTAWAAGGPWIRVTDLILLALAGGLTAAGSAVLNQYLERESDARMPRTAERPLPAGRLLNPDWALFWGILLCTSGLTLAFQRLPIEVTVFMLLGILIYIPLYTWLLKPTTPWSVVIGGAAGCCPVLAGWAVNRLDWPLYPFALAAVVFFWTPAHFWSYAIRHELDYAVADFPTLPSLIGKNRTAPLILAHATVAVVAAVAVLRGWPLLISGAAGMVYLGFCLQLCRKPDQLSASRAYRASNIFLFLVFLSLLI